MTAGVTVAACLTPAGSAAIATLAVQGPRAWAVAAALFKPRSAAEWPPANPEVGRFWLGRFGEQPGGAAADEVVLTLRRLTPVACVEVHCHGGREVVRWLLETLAARDVQVLSWQEFVRRTAEDPLQAAAQIALAEAPTARTASILLDQANGAFRRAVDAVRAAVQNHDAVEAGRLLSGLEKFTAVGRHLTAPWRVAVLGAPNVGKSSLVNALAGYRRSIVAPTPGTTRDVVTTSIAVDGWPVELSDTAGLRDTAEDLEEQGIGRARRAAGTADLCLWVLDATAAPVWPPPDLPNVRPIINKIDVPAGWDLDRVGSAVRISARTGAGIPELAEALAQWLVPEPPPPGAAVPFQPGLVRRMGQVKRLVDVGRLTEAGLLLDRLGEEAVGSQGEM